MNNPIRIPLHDGDLITVVWSGEPRTVIADLTGEQPALRDLTDAEQQEVDREIAAEEGARWQEAPR